MSESEYAKARMGYDFGVTPEVWVTFREQMSQFDRDGSGALNQAEAEAAIDAMGGSGGIMLPGNGSGQSLTVTQQAVLWQMANKSWRPKNNPYSTSIGQEVYDALNGEGGE